MEIGFLSLVMYAYRSGASTFENNYFYIVETCYSMLNWSDVISESPIPCIYMWK
jgi:hypothetical protein